MKITALRKRDEPQLDDTVMRGTEAQDAIRPPSEGTQRRRFMMIGVIGGLALLLTSAIWLVRGWFASEVSVPLERLRIASVTRGHFIRDVAGQGTIIAAISPTLFATAAGTINYKVRAGDPVTEGTVLATLDSPTLRNEYEREQATLQSLDAALERQSIDVRRQNLRNKQEADLASVQITAAQRELARAEAAWNERVISERDYRRANDDVSTARLNFEHARETALLERDSLVLDLRTRRLERDRQALVVENLKRRVADLDVRSPVDGTVSNLAQQEKASVTENAPLITVVDLSQFEVEFQVAEGYATEIKPGMAAELQLDGRTHAGTVSSISPEVRQSQVTGRVKFAAGQPAKLRQNQRVAVRIVPDERENVLQFTRGSGIDESSTHVYVVHGDLASRTPVQLGAASVSMVEVLQGAAVDDQIVVSDTRDFRDAPQILIAN